jgi:hypothetical protein
VEQEVDLSRALPDLRIEQAKLERNDLIDGGPGIPQWIIART